MKIFRVFFILLFYTASVFSSQNNSFSTSKDKITSLPGFGEIKNIELAGYLPTSSTNLESGKLFYWFVENQMHSSTAPLVLWLNGGPGAASLYGFFMENGPYAVNKNGTLSKRQYVWTEQADYLIIDQPAGVGFSYEGKKSYSNDSEAMDQLYFAVKSFFSAHPELASKPLYLAGESYAGKYIPQLAIRILAGNTSAQSLHLKGLLLGDAWVNPRLQQRANAEFAYSHGLIDHEGYDEVLKLYDQCIKEIDKETPSSRRANQVCIKMQDFIKKASGGLDLANISTGEEPDDTDMIHYLNNPNVRKALHVDSRAGQFNTFSEKVAQRLEIGEQDSVADLYPSILKAGVRVLIYNGLEDAKDSNFISTDLWLAELHWANKRKFAKAPTCVWRVNGKIAGYMKTASGLTQVKIRNAGHLAPIDQPERLLNLFNHFINDQSLCY